MVSTLKKKNLIWDGAIIASKCNEKDGDEGKERQEEK